MATAKPKSEALLREKGLSEREKVRVKVGGDEGKSEGKGEGKGESKGVCVIFACERKSEGDYEGEDEVEK